MSRRRFLGCTSASVAAVLVVEGAGGIGQGADAPVVAASGSSNSGSRAAEEIVVVNYGGKSLDVMNATIFPQFEAETGTHVIGTGGMDPAKMQEMVRQNAVEWDVVLLGPEE